MALTSESAHAVLRAYRHTPRSATFRRRPQSLASLSLSDCPNKDRLRSEPSRFQVRDTSHNILLPVSTPHSQLILPGGGLHHPLQSFHSTRYFYCFFYLIHPRFHPQSLHGGLAHPLPHSFYSCSTVRLPSSALPLYILLPHGHCISSFPLPQSPPSSASVTAGTSTWVPPTHGYSAPECPNYTVSTAESYASLCTFVLHPKAVLFYPDLGHP